MKTCTNCKIPKPRSAFNKNRSAKDGLQNWCRDCWRIKWNQSYQRVGTLSGDELERRRQYQRDQYLQGKYGITFEEYQGMMIAQQGKCAICGGQLLEYGKIGGQDTANVDHCHIHNKVRGLLCQPCNHGIARLGEDPARLRAAADYLERYNC